MKKLGETCAILKMKMKGLVKIGVMLKRTFPEVKSSTKFDITFGIKKNDTERSEWWTRMINFFLKGL